MNKLNKKIDDWINKGGSKWAVFILVLTAAVIRMQRPAAVMGENVRIRYDLRAKELFISADGTGDGD